MTTSKKRNKPVEETILLPKRIERKGVVYQDQYKKIERIVALFDSFHKEYFVSDSGKKAAVLVIRNDEVLLTRQYRLLLNGLSYEIPGGKVNDAENADAAAIRECLEETGVRCLNLKPLICFNPDLDCSRNYTQVFFTKETEEITKEAPQRAWIHCNDCLDMIFAEKISDSLSVIAILAYFTLLSRNR
ncbi:MAG: NUDIX hydrolase [Syntrophus sp. (in: bacteria)]